MSANPWQLPGRSAFEIGWRFLLAVLLVLVLLAVLPDAGAQTEATLDDHQVIDRALRQEQALVAWLRTQKPIVETYIQILRSGKSERPALGDEYFLRQVDFSGPEIREHMLFGRPGTFRRIQYATKMHGFRYYSDGFSYMVFVDRDSFDREHYRFERNGTELLAGLHCLVFNVHPASPSDKERFEGRIWVEDKTYSIVRFKGTYTGSTASALYFHSDSWRRRLNSGRWVPAYVFTQENNLSARWWAPRLTFKGQTYVWGYVPDPQPPFPNDVAPEQSGPVSGNAVAPLAFTAAETRVAQSAGRLSEELERAFLLAQEGEVEAKLRTIVAEIQAANGLRPRSQVRCRVLLTTPLESFSLNNTIFLSRGLLDVLPDDASVAVVLAHELAHILLGQSDVRAAPDRHQPSSQEAGFSVVKLGRSGPEEAAAVQKAIELLQHSPYRNRMASAVQFLRWLDAQQKTLPNLLRPRFTDGFNRTERATMMLLLGAAAGATAPHADGLPALPVSGRFSLEPRAGRLTPITNRTAPSAAEDERPLEITFAGAVSDSIGTSAQYRRVPE